MAASLMIAANPYRAAGTFVGPTYIERSADQKILKELYDNQRYPYISAPRQSGKSSLLARTMDRLSGRGFLCAFVDLSTFQLEDPISFVRQFLQAIARGTGLARDCINPEFMADTFLAWLRSTSLRLLVCIDEIDVLIKANFKVQFLSEIRSLFNQRANERELERLQFVLSGATHPSRLIPDTLRSPFNVGVEIPLVDLAIEQVSDLTAHLMGAGIAVDRNLAHRIFEYTRGKVYLSQLILERLWEQAYRTKHALGLLNVDETAADIIREGAHDVHFTAMWNRLKHEHALHMQWKSWLAGRVPDEHVLSDLLLSGICARDRPFHNEIYRRVFGRGGSLDLVSLLSPSERLDKDYALREELVSAGRDTEAVDAKIREVKRALRSSPALQAGDYLDTGRYELREQLGKGGFATVWLSWDRRDLRLVAIKVLHMELAQDQSRRERFFRGARVMGQLNHPGIVRILNPRGEDGEIYYFVMEYVQGCDLQKAVLEGKVKQSEEMRIIAEVGDALEYAHQRGIVHRDVKPSNILLEDNRVPRLTDFDLVWARDTTGGTRTGALGTFLYTAPEALDSSMMIASPKADIYSLAMTALFVLNGGQLSPSQVLHNLEQLLGQISDKPIRRVLSQALVWDPAKRYQSMGEFVEGLRGHSGELRPTPSVFLGIVSVLAIPSLLIALFVRKVPMQTMKQILWSQRQSCQAGNADDCLNAGLKSNGAAAVELFRRACNLGSPGGCLMAGLSYETMPGTLVEGAQYIEKQCMQGNVASCRYLGTLYATGRGVPKDVKRAEEFYIKACESGVAEGCRDLGNFYRQERSASGRLDAIRLFERACKLGDEGSCRILNGENAPNSNDQ